MSGLTLICVNARGTTAARAALALAASLCVLLPATAAHAQPASEFALRVPLTLERNEGLHALELPENVYRASLSVNLLDLRIFNARGESLALAPLPVPPAPAARLEEAPALTGQAARLRGGGEGLDTVPQAGVQGNPSVEGAGLWLYGVEGGAPFGVGCHGFQVTDHGESPVERLAHFIEGG